MIFNKRYELTIAENYVQGWGVREAVRELLQNALDAPTCMQIWFSEDSMHITSPDQKLTMSSLLLGAGTKSDDPESIGKFGEGYKIAMLVLVRMGYRVKVYNNDRLWTPSLEESKTFKGQRVLTIREKGLDEFDPHGALTFCIEGLTEQDRLSIRGSFLGLQSDVESVSDDERGRILLNRPGELYVNGLFVCNTKMDYGYDLHPTQITLERDRNTVDGFDMKFIAQRLWFRLATPERVAKEIEAGIPDLEYANFGTPELVKEACYRLFQERHPGAVVAENQQELERLVSMGLERVVVVGQAFGGIVQSSESYKARAPSVTMTIKEELHHWFHTFGKQGLNRRAKEEFRAILRKSDKWRK